MSLPAYPTYRDSGVPWLGQVPVTWGVVPLKAVASCNDDVLAEDTPPDQVIEYVEISDVEADRGITSRSAMMFGDAPSRARRRVQRGDVIVSTVRTYLRAIATAPEDCDTLVVSTGFAVFRPQRVEAGFLSYVFHAEEIISEIIARSVGVSYPAINASDIARLAIPLPPPAEQRAIAAFLDRECGKIDALVAEQERLIALLKEKRQAVISHAVTKGLDPTAPMKDSGVAWLGQVPAHWDVRQLRTIARLETGHTPSRQHPEYWVESECVIPWFTLADLGYLRNEANIAITQTSQMISEVGIRNSAARLLPARTVILSRTASVGFSGIMERPMAVSQDFAAWICGPSLKPEYLLFCLRAMKGEFQRLMMGSTHQTIYMPDIEAFRVPVPPVTEQSEIVGLIAQRTTGLDALTTEAERAIALLKERRAALISAAVTGKIDVRGLAPAEEAKAA